MEKPEEFALFSVNNLRGEMDFCWPAPVRHGSGTFFSIRSEKCTRSPHFGSKQSHN